MDAFNMKGCEFCIHYDCCDGNELCCEYESYEDIDDAVISLGRIEYRHEFFDYVDNSESYDIYSINM